jgi:hypothetical protein
LQLLQKRIMLFIFNFASIHYYCCNLIA